MRVQWILKESTTKMSKLFLKGKTKRYNLKSPTENGIIHWINVCVSFDQNGIITGSGISLIPGPWMPEKDLSF